MWYRFIANTLSHMEFVSETTNGSIKPVSHGSIQYFHKHILNMSNEIFRHVTKSYSPSEYQWVTFIGPWYAVLIILKASFHLSGLFQQVKRQYSTGTFIVYIFSDEEIQASGFDWFSQLLNGKVEFNFYVSLEASVSFYHSNKLYHHWAMHYLWSWMVSVLERKLF